MRKRGFGIWVLRFLFCISLILIYQFIVNFKVIFNFFNKILKILRPFIIGGTISFLFYPLCRNVEGVLSKTNNKFLIKRARGVSTAVVVIVFIFFTLSLFLKIVPMFYEAMLKFLEDVSYNFTEFYSMLEHKAKNMEFLNSILKEVEKQFSFNKLTKFIVSLNYKVYVGGIANLIFKLANFFIGFIISIYILLDRSNIKKAIFRIFNLVLKEEKKNEILQFLQKTRKIIYTFIFGQIVDAFIVGCFIGTILSLFKINNALIFAVIYFILAIVPYFGPISAVILISLFSYVMCDFNQFVTCSAITLVCQQIDSHLVNPKIVGQIVGVKPLYVILGIMLFGGLFGAVGFFLGPALMAVFLEFVDDLVKVWEMKKQKRNVMKAESLRKKRNKLN